MGLLDQDLGSSYNIHCNIKDLTVYFSTYFLWFNGDIEAGTALPVSERHGVETPWEAA